MNYFYDMCDDIKNEILYIRDNYYANKIINAWYRYIGKKIVARQLLIYFIITFKHNIFLINI